MVKNMRPENRFKTLIETLIESKIKSRLKQTSVIPPGTGLFELFHPILGPTVSEVNDQNQLNHNEEETTD